MIRVLSDVQENDKPPKKKKQKHKKSHDSD